MGASKFASENSQRSPYGIQLPDHVERGKSAATANFGKISTVPQALRKEGGAKLDKDLLHVRAQERCRTSRNGKEPQKNTVRLLINESSDAL